MATKKQTAAKFRRQLETVAAQAPDPTACSALTWRDEHNAVKPLTIERARELVRTILAQDEDEQARALVELVTGIAYDQDHQNRDGLALWSVHAAYSKTMEFSQAAEAFATRAATRRAGESSEEGGLESARLSQSTK